MLEADVKGCVRNLAHSAAPIRMTCLGEIGPQRIINDDDPAVGKGLHGMADVARHDRDDARSDDLDLAVNGHLKFTLDHLIDLFLRMEVLVNGRATLEVVVRERHARRLEIASIPARQALNHIEGAGVYEGHRVLATHSNSTGEKSCYRRYYDD